MPSIFCTGRVLLTLLPVPLKLNVPLDRLWCLCDGDRPPAKIEGPEAALSELLGSKASTYFGTDGLPRLSPYCRSQISWPTQAGAVPLLQVLPETELPILADQGSRLRLPPEELAARRRSEGTPGPIGILPYVMTLMSTARSSTSSLAAKW